MMVQSSSFISDFDIRNLSPLFDDSVVIFIVTDGNWIMYDISNSIDKFVDEFELLFFLFFYNLLLFLVGIFLLDFFEVGNVAKGIDDRFDDWPAKGQTNND